MHYLKKPSWHIPERQATPEGVYLNRRKLLKAAGVGSIGVATALRAPAAKAVEEKVPGLHHALNVPTAGLYPATRNAAFELERPLTDEKLNAQYNNFYEFGGHKRIYTAAQDLTTRPWTVEVGGLCDAPKTWDVDDLIRAMPLEERLYRHRCVEAWAMTIPWTGFALADFLKKHSPTSDARYVKFYTFEDKTVARGQWNVLNPWPYTEALTIDEAMNELAFLVTGTYGHSILKQHGAPLRLAVPWKYGFKSIKSIVKIEFVKNRPTSFWEELAPNEYGFWANVNPQVPHPRWSQQTERMLGGEERFPTRLYNGYAEQVADLYKDMDTSGRTLFY